MGPAMGPERRPFRRCVLTRAVLPKERMVRFVIGPEAMAPHSMAPDAMPRGRTLVPDLAGRLPGRGIWLSARGDVIETARVRGTLQRAIARAAGGSVAIPADFRERLVAGLERRIAQLLARARRAGEAGPDRDSRTAARTAKLADAVRAEVERLAGLRGAGGRAADAQGTGTWDADGWRADEGTGGRVHDGRQ